MVVSAYVYVRFSIKTPAGFTPAQAKDTTGVTKPAESFLDLKPKLIEKLQQLVKQGSNGLYNLFVRELKPDVLNSTVRITDASLVPDTAAMKELERSKNLPDEIFKIKARSILIDGLGLRDILSKDVIDLKAIRIIQPTIEVYSQSKSNNQIGSSKTLYQRLMNQMKHIGIGKMIIEKGTLVTYHPENKPDTKFDDIAINFSNIVIDSTTQFDHSRFLFAKDAELTMKDYSVPTSNRLYTFKVGIISIKATKQLLVARAVSLQPNYSRTEFQNHIKTQLERYEISIPAIEFKNADWWSLINNKTLLAKSAEINHADVHVFLDRRKPAGAIDMRGFPDQLIMKLQLKLNVEKLRVNDLDLTYEEFSKLSNQTGKVYVDNLHGTISNVTNLPEAIKRNHTTRVNASGIFMHVAPATLTLNFDLSNYKTGVFSAEFKSAKGFNGNAINSIAEPLGLFMVKRGHLKELSAHVSGNNYQASGNVLMLYDNLHITPMKKDPQNPGELKKKSFTSLIANSFVLKDENPSKDGQVRKETATFTRGSGTFFNLVWKTIFVGILKTIGAPEKLAYE